MSENLGILLITIFGILAISVVGIYAIRTMAKIANKDKQQILLYYGAILLGFQRGEDECGYGRYI